MRASDVNWSTAAVLSDVCPDAYCSHEPAFDSDRRIVVRDDDAHPVRNFTDSNNSAVWVEVAFCDDYTTAQKQPGVL